LLIFKTGYQLAGQLLNDSRFKHVNNRVSRRRQELVSGEEVRLPKLMVSQPDSFEILQ
jgi:hypothetical protein